MIRGGIEGLWPSDAANFLNRMETVVTLTGLELTLDILFGKLVYTCTQVGRYCCVTTNSLVFVK